MEYNSLEKMPHYKECSLLVESLGYVLVELRIVPQKTQYKVLAVISNKAGKPEEENVESGIGISDCAKVHRLIEPRLEALLNSKDLYMEVTSPGMERTIKNAAEFCLFEGRMIRVWDTEVTEWVHGKLLGSDEKSLTLEKEDSSAMTIPYERIAKAKLLTV
ncbi:MAG: ribosome maturation factor [Treponemataceae bacterium]|nr:ribosome maturation factor [Treponemataceae bacterium]